jgi:hypothetical protein
MRDACGETTREKVFDSEQAFPDTDKRRRD